MAAEKPKTPPPKNEAYLGSGTAEAARRALKSRGSRIEQEEAQATSSFKTGGMVRRGYGAARGA